MRKKRILGNVKKELLVRELNQARFIRKTNKDNNEIYIFDYHSAPNLMLEVARLRETTFRKAGGGTGNYLDIDHFDFQQQPYKQLIVWDPVQKEIAGGYRFAWVPEVTQSCRYLSRITFSDHFNFSGDFVENYLPWSIELGRAFITPKYQSTGVIRKSIFILDNLWDGLGALIKLYPDARYFFGKVTLYRQFPEDAKLMLLNFMYNYFGQTGLVKPIHPMELPFGGQKIHTTKTFSEIENDYAELSGMMRKMGTPVPPMFNAYLKLSPSIKVMGTFHNKDFGNTDETAILITIRDIYSHKLERYTGIQSTQELLKKAG
ncbi:MAG TPA: GNAT family N-acetyltransferase [Bacteroidales bacterium]|nr:GNAT family N-acetyltransferase [Bacteroidales bacterium]